MKIPLTIQRRILLFGLLAMLLWAVPMAAAEVREGKFQIDMYGPEDVQWDTAQNDGYNSTWYMYPIPPQSPAPPPFWNQWWWNDPYIQGGKWVQVSFDYKLLNPELPGDVFITINWTNGQWVGQQSPPTWQNSANPETFISRLSDPEFNLNLEDWRFMLPPGTMPGQWDSGKIWLPINYNPEGVSVDVQGMGNVGIYNGGILHECIPEPATLLLMAFGGSALLGHKR